MRTSVPKMLLVHPEKGPPTTLVPHREALGSNVHAARSPLATLIKSSSEMTRHPPPRDSLVPQSRVPTLALLTPGAGLFFAVGLFCAVWDG